MKRSLILILVVGLLLFKGLIHGVNMIQDQADDVQVICNVMEGDSDCAEGISFRVGTHWLKRLNWNTYVTIEDEGKADYVTFFEKDLTAESKYRHYTSSILDDEVRIFLFSNSYNVQSDNLNLEEFKIHPYFEAIKYVAEKTKPGEIYTEEIKLKDYRKFYEIELELYLNRGPQNWEENSSEYINEFFKIQIPETHKFYITIGKDKQGSMCMVQNDSVTDGVAFQCCSVQTKEGLYFSFYGENADGRMQNLTMESGNGVFFLPLVDMKNGDTSVLFKELKNVFPLPNKDCFPIELLADESGEKLLLFTRENEQLVIRVIHVATMQELEKHILIDFPEGTQLVHADSHEEGIFAVLTNGSFAFLHKKDNSYERQIVSELGQGPEASDKRPFIYDLDYQNDRLALVCAEDYYRSSVYVYVFGAEGMEYKAQYLNCVDYESNYFDQHIYLQEENPLEIWFTEENAIQ